MKAIIPAAGYATRMYPLTQNKPKALLNICGKPVIEWVIKKVSLIDDIKEILIVSNNKFYNDFLEWKDKFTCEKELKIINDGTEKDEERLGTVGDIYYALTKENIREDFLIVNSDNLFNFNLEEIWKYFREKKSTVIGLHDVKDLNNARKLGSPKIDEFNKIVYFIEKDPIVKSTLCSIGIYLFPAYIIDFIKNYLDKGKSPDKSGEFIQWLYNKKDIYGFIFDKGDWFDIGSMESYEKANKIWATI